MSRPADRTGGEAPAGDDGAAAGPSRPLHHPPHATAPPRALRVLVALDRLVLSVFFRRVEVEGRERVPARGPLVVVANHVNGLIDPMLVLGCLPLVPRFLGKSTLWDIPPLRPFLRWARVIPVYRRSDAADVARNAETFAASRAALAEGGAVALFPEGKSHSEPGLAPLKTGAARIALEAEAAHGPLGVRVLPVGLVFDRRERFRSRALVEVGEPFAAVADGERPAGPPADPGAVRELTSRIDRALQEVTVHFASWEEARLVARAAEIFARPARRPSLARTAAARRAFAAGHRRLAALDPDRFAAAAEAVRRYDRLLAAASLRDEQVAAAYEAPPVLRFLRRTLATLLLRLPLALVGTALNALPFQVVSAVARRIAPADQKATWKVFPSLVVYPLTWLAEAAAAGWGAARAWGAGSGWAAALAVLLLAPLSGRVALGFHDRGSRLAEEVRAFLVLRTRRRFAAELRAERADVRRRVAELVELYRVGANV